MFERPEGEERFLLLDPPVLTFPADEYDRVVHRNFFSHRVPNAIDPLLVAARSFMD